jgi:cation transport ATPase
MAAMLVLVTGSLFFALPLPLAVVGHEGGTVLVVLNGLRLLFDPIRSDRA